MESISVELDVHERQAEFFKKVFYQSHDFRKAYHQEWSEALVSETPFDRDAYIARFKDEYRTKYGKLNLNVFDAEADLIEMGLRAVGGHSAAFSKGIQVSPNALFLPFFRVIKSHDEFGPSWLGNVADYCVVWLDEEGQHWATLYRSVAQ